MNYLSEVRGRSGTVARVVAYSQAENSGTKLITFEYESYRAILSETNTHGILCKNAESTRAVPVEKRSQRILDGDFYTPISWGLNQSGMVAGEESNENIDWNGESLTPEEFWKQWAEENAKRAIAAKRYHKQVVGRPLEAFTTVKGVITATEWDNFWHLRRAPDADPAIKELADCMWKAKCEVEEKGLVEILKAGEWHTPYYGDGYWKPSGNQGTFNGFDFFDIDNHKTPLTVALKTSAVGCGQVSFRKLDTSEETVERVWKRLMEGETIHASVTQHQGTPMSQFSVSDGCGMDLDACDVDDGVTHVDVRNGNFWSAQFKHWIMFRKTIPNEVCNNYIPQEV